MTGRSSLDRSWMDPGTPEVDRIALYGSLMRGLGALERLGIPNALHFEGSCSIPGQLFDLGRYPGLRQGPGCVAGELYRLETPRALAELDAFEDFDPRHPDASLYLRVRIVLLEPAHRPAWVYVYNQRPDPSLRIPSGDWRAHLRMRGRVDPPASRPEEHTR